MSWAFEELNFEHQPLLDAISGTVLRSIERIEPMPMATLLDRRLSPECHEALQRRLFPLLDAFYARIVPASNFWRDGGYQRLVLDCQIGNFGAVGGRYLLSKLGIPSPPVDFISRGQAEIPRLGRMMGDVYMSGGADFLRQRVLSYAEYTLTAPGAPLPVQGAGCYENGRAYASRWLTPVQPPFCPFADRGTCSEFRMLASLCDLLARADPRSAADEEGRKRFGGRLCVLVSGPSCVSCLGAFAQFRFLFPGILIQVAAGKSSADDWLPTSSISSTREWGCGYAAVVD